MDSSACVVASLSACAPPDSRLIPRMRWKSAHHGAIARRSWDEARLVCDVGLELHGFQEFPHRGIRIL
jgi:hypothetical protein